MSTYYYFHCTKHMQEGGCFTRQAWGYGNADLIEAFKFVMYHVRECGQQHIGMHSEHEGDDYASTCIDDDVRREFLEATKDIMPHSSDWAFMERAAGKDWKELWVSEQLAQIPESG